MIKVIVDIACVMVEIGLLRYIYKVFFPICRISRYGEMLLYVILAMLALASSQFEIAAEQRMYLSLCIDLVPAFFYLEKNMAKVFVGTLFFAVQISCELFSWAFLALITGDIADSLDGHAIQNYIQGVFLSKSLAAVILYFTPF